MEENNMSIITDEVVKDHNGNTISTKEYINEIKHKGLRTECITREIIKMNGGRIVLDQVIYKSSWERTKD